MAKTGDIRVKREDLENLCTQVFKKLGMPDSQAKDSAEILVAADARGDRESWRCTALALCERHNSRDYAAGYRKRSCAPNTDFFCS